MADDLRAFIFQIEEATGQPSSEEPSDFAAVRGWIGLVASERGLRMLTLPVADHAAALNILRGDYPDAPSFRMTLPSWMSRGRCEPTCTANCASST